MGDTITVCFILSLRCVIFKISEKIFNYACLISRFFIGNSTHRNLWYLSAHSIFANMFVVFQNPHILVYWQKGFFSNIWNFIKSSNLRQYSIVYSFLYLFVCNMTISKYYCKIRPGTMFWILAYPLYRLLDFAHFKKIWFLKFDILTLWIDQLMTDNLSSFKNQ